MEIVIDTSALLAVVAMEPERAELIRLTRGASLVAPSSVHWEIGNALSAMFKRKAIELDDAVKVGIFAINVDSIYEIGLVEEAVKRRLVPRVGRET